MEDSVFTKIIKGELPSAKVYEDDKTFVFLPIDPLVEGHVLVVPKAQVDHFEDLPEDDYQALFTTVKKVAKRVQEVYSSERAIVTIFGFQVPHAHVHIMPGDGERDFIMNSYERLQQAEHGTLPAPDYERLSQIAKKLAF